MSGVSKAVTMNSGYPALPRHVLEALDRPLWTGWTADYCF